MSKVVVVTYKNEILGSGEFWRGTVDEVYWIPNFVARDLAQKVFTGKVDSLSSGMWTATLVKP